jgi:hypothetical protein
MRRLIALVAIALLLVAGAQATDHAVRETGDLSTVDNETFSPTGGSVTQLADSERDVSYNLTADVYVNDNEIEDDGNYSWVATNGTVRTVNNSYLDNQTDANISYGYTTNPEQQQDIATTLGFAFGFGRWLVLLLGVGIVIMVLGVLT